MTNGEKLKEVFPSIELYEKSHDAIQINFDSVWWNAEYKEPTTKNDLEVDCISRVQALKELKESAEHHANNSREAVLLLRDRDIIRALPSVTPQEPRWILVSERLPENKETVLVTFKHFVSGNTIGLGSVILLRGKPHWHVREQNLGTYDVLAWMPLPKSYREVEE